MDIKYTIIAIIATIIIGRMIELTIRGYLKEKDQRKSDLDAKKNS